MDYWVQDWERLGPDDIVAGAEHNMLQCYDHVLQTMTTSGLKSAQIMR